MLKGETIMRKVFELEDLDCANCAAKIEREIASIPGVNYVNVSFMMQKLTIDIDDGKFDEEISEIMEKISSDVTYAEDGTTEITPKKKPEEN